MVRQFNINLHTQRVLPGSVPDDWLGQSNMVICTYCYHLAISSHLHSHHGKCPLKPTSTGLQQSQECWCYNPLKTCAYFIAVPPDTSLLNPGQHSQVFYRQNSIQFYNSEAWLMFLMLLKHVHMAPKWRWHHHKPLPINLNVIYGPRTNLQFCGNIHLSKWHQEPVKVTQMAQIPTFA